MTLNKTFVYISSLFVLIILSTSSCKKKKAFKNEDAQTSVDARVFQGQIDAAMADINLAIMGQPLLRGKLNKTNDSKLEGICGLDTTMLGNGKILLEYNGEECNGVKRTGEVLVTIVDYPIQKWKNAGTQLKIEFKAYKAVWTSGGKFVQIDGSATLTNESGKTWYDMQYLNVPDLVQILTGSSIQANYGGDNNASYNLNRRMEYSFSSSNQVTSCKVTGLGSFDGASGLENWGLTRDGKKFSCAVTSPLIWKTSCGAGTLIDGSLSIDMEDKAFNLDCDFAVDASGNSVNTDNPCPYGWYVSWSYKNKTNSRIFAYN